LARRGIPTAESPSKLRFVGPAFRLPIPYSLQVLNGLIATDGSVRGPAAAGGPAGPRTLPSVAMRPFKTCRE